MLPAASPGDLFKGFSFCLRVIFLRNEAVLSFFFAQLYFTRAKPTPRSAKSKASPKSAASSSRASRAKARAKRKNDEDEEMQSEPSVPTSRSSKRARKKKEESEPEEEVEEDESEQGDDEDEDASEEESSEEEVEYNITTRKRRKTAAKQEKVFAGKAKEDHEAFWGDDNFKEEDDDSNISFSSSEEELWTDSSDSDISRSDDSEIDAEDDAALAEANKEAMESDKKPKRGGGGFGVYKDPRFAKKKTGTTPKKKKPVKKEDVFVPVERTLRASTLARTWAAKEEASIRLAEQQERKRLREERDKNKPQKKALTHEDKVANMYETEQINKADLERILALADGKDYDFEREQYEGPRIQWKSSKTPIKTVTKKDAEGNEYQEHTYSAKEVLNIYSNPKKPIDLLFKTPKHYLIKEDPKTRATVENRVKYFQRGDKKVKFRAKVLA